MNIYKKIMMLFVIIGALSGIELYARCNSCAEKLALKQSIKDALAASLANKPSTNKPSTNKPSKHQEIDTLEDMQDQNEPCCASCASGGECDNKKCSCSKPKPPRPPRPSQTRAPRPSSEFQPLINPMESENSQLDEIQCLLEVLLKKNAFCCKMVHSIKDKVKDQKHESEKCCKKLKERIEDLEELIITQIDQAADCCSLVEELIFSQTDISTDCCSLIEELILSQIDQSADCCSLIEELIISQIDQSADCCSLIEELIISQIDQAADCCSLTETLLISQIDQSLDCCSLTETLLISQIDQAADCCSMIDTRLGELTGSAVDFPISEELETFVNDAQFDVITWLKSIYLLLGQLFVCNDCLPD